MYIVQTQTEFRASHGVEMPDGNRERPHEHRWRVEAAVQCSRLDRRQMGMDFCQLRALLDEITGPLENLPLHEHKAFQQTNATAEAVARFIYDQLAPQLPPEKKLAWIEVTEAPGCRARYLPD